MGQLPRRPGGEVRSPARLGRDSADHLVNTLRRQVNRPDDDLRPVHRIGVITKGRFEPSGALDDLTSAGMLTVGSSDAVVRFSSFGNGDWRWEPDIRGMACRLIDDRGDELDLVAMSMPRFLARREEDYLAFPTKPGGALVFALTRRTTFTAIVAKLRFERSFPLSHRVRHLAAERYFGVHTFWLERSGSYRGMRYHWRPVKPAKNSSKDLESGLVEMVDGDATVEFDLVVDLFDEDPPLHRVHDALRRWPSVEREWPLIRRRRRWRGMTRLIAGRLTLTEIVAADHPGHRWVFDPVPTIGGFEASDDEILQARGTAYRASHVRRSARSAQPA